MNNSHLNNISDNLYILLLSLNRQVFNPSELTKKFNAPHSHIKVLFYLIHHGPTSISKMAKDLYISKPNMTPVLDKLVEDGLVNRYYDPNDRRVIRVETTSKACNFLKSGEEHIKSLLKERLLNLDEEDLSNLSNSLETLITIIRKF